MQKGIEFVPARLKQKTPRDAGKEFSRGRAPKHDGGGGMWQHSSSDEDHSDSEDSMSDLYPRESPAFLSAKDFIYCSSIFLSPKCGVVCFPQPPSSL